MHACVGDFLFLYACLGLSFAFLWVGCNKVSSSFFFSLACLLFVTVTVMLCLKKRKERGGCGGGFMGVVGFAGFDLDWIILDCQPNA